MSIEKTDPLKYTNKYLANHGIPLIKLINSGGLFSNPTYDKRLACSWEEVQKLGSEGFCLDEAGIHSFNLIRMGILYDIEALNERLEKIKLEHE